MKLTLTADHLRVGDRLIATDGKRSEILALNVGELITVVVAGRTFRVTPATRFNIDRRDDAA